MDNVSRETIPLVDWLSFTAKAPVHRRTGALQWLDPINRHLCRRQSLVQVTRTIGKDAMDTLFSNLPDDTETGRFPYAYALIDNQTSARIMFDSGLAHIAVEISGKGMALLHEKGLVQSVCLSISSNCSRIDVSCDILSTATPIQFCSAGWNSRIKATMTVESPTGESYYVGSPKSEKRACVYRYAPPHPRSPYLRVEHRYRGASAKAMANYVGTNGLAMAVQYAGLDFDWQSPLWDVGDLAVVPLPDIAGDARDNNFAQWLLRQVFPAMRKAERQGRIDDLRSFVQTHLFDDHGDIADDDVMP